MRAIHEPGDLVQPIAECCHVDRDEAQRAAKAVVDALAEALPEHLTRHFGTLFDDARRRRPQRINNLAELVVDVASTLDATPGKALELLDCACVALGADLTDDDRRVFALALPRDIAELFDVERPTSHVVAEGAPAAAHHGGAGARRRRTLSSGEPGAEHPIASSPADDGAHTLSTGRSKLP